MCTWTREEGGGVHERGFPLLRVSVLRFDSDYDCSVRKKCRNQIRPSLREIKYQNDRRRSPVSRLPRRLHFSAEVLDFIFSGLAPRSARAPRAEERPRDGLAGRRSARRLEAKRARVAVR